jgi:hypothetical protein
MVVLNVEYEEVWPPRPSDAVDVVARALTRYAQRRTLGRRVAFVRHLERASRIVVTWPKWKRNILGRPRSE